MFAGFQVAVLSVALHPVDNYLFGYKAQAGAEHTWARCLVLLPVK